MQIFVQYPGCKEPWGLKVQVYSTVEEVIERMCKILEEEGLEGYGDKEEWSLYEQLKEGGLKQLQRKTKFRDQGILKPVGVVMKRHVRLKPEERAGVMRVRECELFKRRKIQ